jgi:hypothetical protein
MTMPHPIGMAFQRDAGELSRPEVAAHLLAAEIGALGGETTDVICHWGL